MNHILLLYLPVRLVLVCLANLVFSCKSCNYSACFFIFLQRFTIPRYNFANMVMEVRSCSFSWTKEEEKAFENALATLPEDCDDRWERIADGLPGKTIEEIKHHYELLVDDINGIESGQVPLPCYASLCEDGDEGVGNRKTGGHGGKSSKADQERRKGIAWTEEEHRLFLLGLEKYGKGDWRSISRNLVISRTPTQVASHAQKYFIRLQSTSKDKRRTSIHDITNANDDTVTSKGPITSQGNGSMAAAPSASTFGTTIGLPVSSPSMSVVGNLVSAAPAMAYRVPAPFLGTPFPGASMSISPFPYSMPPTSTNR